MNKEKFAGIFLIPVIIFFLFSCATAPATKTAGEAFIIQSKALIKNEGESNTVKIEIAVLPKRAVRLEITATLGVSVATVLMTPRQISYALHSSHEFVTGPFSEKTLFPVFKKNVDPWILWKVVHNQSPANARLKCEVNAGNLPVHCVGPDSVDVKWTYMDAPAKRIDIISNKFEMNWIFKEQSVLAEYQTETFVLKKPDTYKEIIIK